MKQVIVLVSALALGLTVVAAVGSSLVAHAGAGSIADGLEQLTGAAPAARLHSVSAPAALALTSAAAIVTLTGAALRRHWDWLIVLVFVVPIGFFGWYALTIEGAVGPGVLALLLPAATLLYGWRGFQGAFRLTDV